MWWMITDETGRNSSMHLRVFTGLVLFLLGTFEVAAQDAASGEQIFKRCRACHQVGDGAKNAVGPVLNNIIGRAAGSIEGFNYSTANKDAGAKGLVWTEENLSNYLTNPAAFMPKNKMAFAGLKNEQDRKEVIAYLKTFSK
jgi:cytochrome c